MTNKDTLTHRLLLAVSIVTPALALGAVHYSVLAFYLVPAAMLLIYLSTTLRDGKYRRVPLDIPSILFLSMIGFTLLQILPLPAELVKWLSPADYELRTRALRPLGESAPSFMPITLDTTITTVELGKLFLYLSVYWAALAWTRKHGSKFIINLVLGAGVLAAAVFIAHRLFLIDKVYGFYVPSHVRFGGERSSAPLINENHMAALLGLSAAAAIGRAIAEVEKSKRILLLCISGLLGGALLLTLSRGGIVAFIGGQCLFILLRAMKKVSEDGKEISTHAAWLPLGLTVSLGLGLFVAQDAILGEFIGGNAKKLELFVEGLPLVGLFWMFGVGRGAFWVGFPLVKEISTNATFTHAENSVIQILSDYGAVFGAFVLLGFGFVAARFLLHYPKRTEHIAALVALVTFGMHNLVDFNMEVPGVAVLAVALLAVVQGTQRLPKIRKKNSVYLNWKTSGLCAIATACLAVYIGFIVSSRNIDSEERRYRAAWATRDAEPFERENLAAVLSRHPADWYIPFLVGVRHFHLELGNPLPWLARAIELNPTAASAHLYVGRTFLMAGKLDQAMLEMRIAALYNPGLAGAVGKYLVATTSSFETLSKIGVATEDKKLLWSAIADYLAARGHDAEAEKSDIALLSVDPLSPRALDRHARRLAKRGQVDEGIKLAQRLSRLHQHGTNGIKIQADIYTQQGKHQDAIHVLEDGLLRSPRNPALLRTLARARQKSGDYTGALRAVASLRSLATNIRVRSDVAIFEAQLATSEGRIQQALASYRQAHALNPSNTDILVTIANLAEAHGDKKRAVEALKKLENINPHDITIKHRLEAIRIEENTRQEHSI